MNTARRSTRGVPPARNEERKKMTTTDQVKAAVARVDADPNAGTRKRSHTVQTRRVAAALRAIGLKRSDFSARVTYERDGGGRVYGNAIGSPRTREAAQAIAD